MDNLEQKLAGPVAAVIDKHKATIAPLLQGKSADLTAAALKNEEAVRTVAMYCYALLPGLVRLAVKEPTFVSFVLANREKLLARMVATPEDA